MFLIKFFYFLKGYVIIEVYGKSVWRLVSECSEKGIRLYNITGGECAVFALVYDSFYDFYTMACRYGVDVKVRQIYGVEDFISRYGKRFGFVFGLVACVIFFAVSSRYLWRIDVKTDGEITREQVLESLSQIGIKPGVPLKNIPDGRTVKNHLINSIENVPWAWIYINGIQATVQIHEGIVPPVIVDENETCDIVASKPGFVVDVSVKEGQSAVLPGNAVSAGDLLISGTVITGAEGAEKSYFVHSDGEVLALTRYERTSDYSLWDERPEFTGNEKSVYDVELFSHKFRLFSEPGYEYSINTEKNLLSCRWINIKKTEFSEAENHKSQLPKEWVIEFAKRDLTAQIASELGRGARLQSEEYYITENANSLTVKAEMVFVENIGVTVPG